MAAAAGADERDDNGLRASPLVVVVRIVIGRAPIGLCVGKRMTVLDKMAHKLTTLFGGFFLP